MKQPGGTTDPVADTARVRAATDRILTAVARLGDADLSQPSLLHGWTRGHVLAHLARNADAMVDALAGRPMYAGDQAREAAVERDADRPQAVHLDDLRTAATRLDGAFAAQPQGATGWQRTLELRNGQTAPAYSLPFRRWGEVELHHIDLGVGYGVGDLPGAFVDRQLAHLAARFAGHPDLPQAVELRTEDGSTLHTGAPLDAAVALVPPGPGGSAGPERIVVAGAPADLVGWLSGRTGGSGLSASAALPPLPALG